MHIINRVIRLLNSNKVEVRLCNLRGLWGLCDYENHELLINKRLCTISQVKTLIHESIHYIFPNKTEREVLKLEGLVYNHLSFDETNFLRDFLRSKE